MDSWCKELEQDVNIIHHRDVMLYRRDLFFAVRSGDMGYFRSGKYKQRLLKYEDYEDAIYDAVCIANEKGDRKMCKVLIDIIFSRYKTFPLVPLNW